MKIGSQAHKELTCRTFFEGHRKYEPPDLPWPDLGAEQLQLLRSLPFWTHALEFESDAGPMIRAAARHEQDPLMREALELQAYEEERHARLVRHMIGLYALPYEEPKLAVGPNPLHAFTEFGFQECLDSFGAFGLFKLARRSEILPDPIFEIFDNVMREESHHIVFFINWYAHRQANLGLRERWLRPWRSLWYYGKAVAELAKLAGDDDADEGADFIVTGAQAFVDELTPQLILSTCVAENEWRMARFDRRLLLPQLLPRLAAMGSRVLRWLPERSFGSFSKGSPSGPPREHTSHAA